jgi:uncharacterized membrane protein
MKVTSLLPSVSILVIAAFFFIGGVAHFVFTDVFVRIMPNYLGYQKELVLISGLFELLGAIGILFPSTRLLAGYGLIVLIIAVFPANINMAIHPQDYKSIPELLLWLRLPLQFFFVWFVWQSIKSIKSRTSQH